MLSTTQQKHMKCTKFVSLLALLVVAVATGCKRNPQGVTVLPGYKAGVSGTQPGDMLPNTPSINEGNTTSQPIPSGPEGTIPMNANLGSWVPSAEQPAVFRENIVYFDLDQSTIRESETAKLDAIASFMKGAANRAVRVEGHCDERGTEEYNRSLGERRAQSVREHLINRGGLGPNVVDSFSHGEDKPAVQGRGEAAWAKNRRAEFILIEPPGGVGAANPQ
jgi:peptidoglycan-associated lipoprotein